MPNSTSSSSSESQCSAASQPPSIGFQALLKKNLSSENLQTSHLKQYHQRSFVDRIDNIVESWMVGFIFELKDFVHKELTDKVEEAMLDALCADIERHFPVPSSDEQIDQLNALYRNVAEPKPNELPQFYFNAYLLAVGMVPENRIVGRIYSTLRPKFLEAQSQLWRLMYAVHLLTPMEADSHNTGVLVQSKICHHIKSMREANADFLLRAGWLQYGKTRCHYLQQIATVPQSVDARLAYHSFEREYFRYIRTTVEDFAKEMLILQHLIAQHIEFVKQPRQDPAANLAAKIVI